MKDKLKIFFGNSNRPLAEDICKILKIKPGECQVDKFADGEIQVKINENVRGQDVFVIQSTSFPANDNLMELLIMLDALKRASSGRLTAVMPYFGYARQDRKDQGRVPISAKLVANLITRAGANRVLTVDLHAGQIQGFFDIPLDHLFAANILVEYFSKLNIENPVVISPDVGSIKMARAYAKRLNASLAIVDKRRIDDRHAEVVHIMGDVKGKNAIIVDDLVATAGSLVEAAEAIRNEGVEDIYAAITHPVLCGPAIERLLNSFIKEIVVTNTIFTDAPRLAGRLKVLSIAPLLAEAVRKIHNEESISIMFD